MLSLVWPFGHSPQSASPRDYLQGRSPHRFPQHLSKLSAAQWEAYVGPGPQSRPERSKPATGATCTALSRLVLLLAHEGPKFIPGRHSFASMSIPWGRDPKVTPIFGGYQPWVLDA